MSTLAILLRIYVRRKTRAGFHADDHLIFAAGVSVNQALFVLDLEPETDRSLARLCVHLLRGNKRAGTAFDSCLGTSTLDHF